jgi:diacylglycerol kinase family enzyme
MRFLAVLNRDGGTLRTTDIEAFVERSRAVLEEKGHSLRVEVVNGKEVVEALQRAADDEDADVVMAAGGDGTISAAAGCMMNHDRALAVLPAGTMNLFARSLGIPLNLDAAVAAFAEGEIRAVDIATANGQPFVHQLSIGMHARLVELRDKMDFGSRLGKMRASVRAAYLTVIRPPRVHVTLQTEDTQIHAKTAGIGITNNIFGEGHLPYADRLDQRVLGIYITKARTTRDVMMFVMNMMIGRWRRNTQADFLQAREVTLTVRGRRGRRYKRVMDGELAVLDPVTEIKIHPGALKVLAPKAG